MTEEIPKSNIKTLYKYDTVYCADSVEWCPHEPYQNLFVCANYQLLNSEIKNDLPKERVGRILLFSIGHKQGLKLEQTIETAAILDQKWCHCIVSGLTLLGVVNAKNSIDIYKLNNLTLELFTSFKLHEEVTETLVLSLDWSTGKYSNQEPDIICTTSKGDVIIFKLTDGELVLQQLNHSHDYESWIGAFYYWDPNIFFSGGDDCVFLKYDKRTGTAPIAKNRIHEAGVTSMHSNISKEFIFATGSYDENVRLWDIRSFKNPLSAVKMPGPLWRLKWDIVNQSYLLSACMLGGVHVLNVRTNEKLDICESYYEHGNIAYGADWCYVKSKDIMNCDDENKYVIGSCSFYDHLLCVSEITLKF